MTGDEMRDMRLEYHLTQAELAELLAVHVATVQRWEALETRQLARANELLIHDALKGRLK